MDDFDEDPLDLLDDDSDGVVEMPLFFDEEHRETPGEGKPPERSGCCFALFCVGVSLATAGWGITKLIA